MGYVYAIANGAQMIFDFDDDNLMKFWVEGASPDPVLDIDNYDIHGLSGENDRYVFQSSSNNCLDKVLLIKNSLYTR